MNASNVRTSSTPAAASSTSLRPRTKRLISGLSDSEADDLFPSSSTSPVRGTTGLPSPFDSRSASPIPNPHPQRLTSTQKFTGTSWGRRSQIGAQKAKVTGNEQSPSFAGLWGSSWTTLQGIASDLLGNEDGSRTSQRPTKPPSRFDGPRATKQGQQDQWGPAPTSAPTLGGTGIGSGTRQERETSVMAQKRKAMLLRQDSNFADALGKFKRRLSDDHEAMSAPPTENEFRDALVYVHRVKKEDTLAGITIKYNCSANHIRKANRMWPNDTVQTRRTIVLPVDACGIKGRPVPGPVVLDLLSSESEALSDGQAEEVPTPTASSNDGQHKHDHTISSSTDTSRHASSSVAGSAVDSEAPWQHDSWVFLPGNTQPTEVARLSRRALGYFPPARRKSNSYSDLDTPSTSLDLTRAYADSNASPVRHDAPQRPPRPRRLSNAHNGYFPAYLSGPGGVGSMSSNVHFPGPAQDGLNKFFAKHLPDVAPPRNQVDLYRPEMPLYTDDEPPSTGTHTPSLLPLGAASPTTNGMNLNIENVGGAIESWMRRMATRAMTPTERGGPRGLRVSVGAPGKGTGGFGELIEMTDEFEIGGDEEDGEEEEPRRGRRASVVHIGGASGSGTDYFGGGSVVGGGRRVGRSGAGDGKKGGKDD